MKVNPLLHKSISHWSGLSQENGKMNEIKAQRAIDFSFLGTVNAKYISSLKIRFHKQD